MRIIDERERMNLTTRMCNCRFTRLTNCFSKKWINQKHAIALHYFFYNLCRKHQTLGTTPAVAAPVTDKVWKIEDLVQMLIHEESKNRCHGRTNKADRS